MSIFIFFSNLIPWLLFQTSLIGFFGDSLLFPSRNHNVFAFGKSIFLLFVTQPVSIKYPSLNFFGFNKIILSFPLSVLVYFLKVKSSIVAPIKEIDPFIFSFSNLILSFSSIASSLEIFDVA